MINLLTPEIRKKLKREEREREIIVVLWLLFTLLTIVLIFNLALWFNLEIQKQTLGINRSEVQSRNLATRETLEDKQINSKIKQLTGWWPVQSWFTVLTKIQQSKSATIKISRLVGETSDKILKMALVGEAVSRQELVSFVNNLRQDKFFANVDLPIGNLLGNNKNQFTLNLIIANHD